MLGRQRKKCSDRGRPGGPHTLNQKMKLRQHETAEKRDTSVGRLTPRAQRRRAALRRLDPEEAQGKIFQRAREHLGVRSRLINVSRRKRPAGILPKVLRWNSLLQNAAFSGKLS